MNKHDYGEWEITYRNFRKCLARAVVHARSEQEAAQDFRRSVKGGPNQDAVIVQTRRVS